MLFQALVFLPDPVRGDCGDLAGRDHRHGREQGQRDVEVVVGMRTPSGVVHLAKSREPNRALYGLEMRVGRRNVRSLELGSWDNKFPKLVISRNVPIIPV